MPPHSFKNTFSRLGPVTVAAAVLLFILYKMAYVENTSNIWAFSIALLLGVFFAIGFLTKPFETILLYAVLFPILIPLNEVRLVFSSHNETQLLSKGPLPAIAVGGVIHSVMLLFGGFACLRRLGRCAREVRAVLVLSMLFLLWMLVGLAVNMKHLNLMTALKEIGRILGVYVVFFVGYLYARDVRDIRKFVYALFLSLIVPLSVAAFQVISGTEYAKLEGYNRVMGTFGIPNMFAMYLVLPLTLLLALSLSKHVPLINRYVFFGVFSLVLVVLFFTYTRASWLALLVAVVFLGLKEHRMLLPFVMLGGLVMLGTFSLQMLRLHEVEGSGRLGIWMALLPTSLSSPIVGQGITSMTSVSFRRLGFINQGQNQYLLYLIESGVVGLVFYVALIWSLYRKCSHYISRMPSGIYRDLAVGFKASLLGIYTIAFFESNAVFQNWVWLPAGVFLGASVQYARKSEQANPVNKKC